MEPESEASGQSSTDSVASMAVGSYILETLRGRHGDYEVWTAVHQPTDVEVVMDVYAKSGDDKRLVESVLHKIDLFTSLAEAKVLRLLEVMDSMVAIFLVYEYYSSQSLRDYVLNCPLGGKEFKRLVQSLISIVHGLHRHCYFHGTLTADSFVLTRQKKIKFKDAPSCHAFLQSQAEPARFDAILSKASDVWSVGALIYQLISHQFASGLTSAQGPGDATSTVVQLVSQTDADLSDLLTRMTDQNPAARISTADCLRHPFLTRNCGLPPQSRGLRAPSCVSRRINLDVVRFLSRATGAPVADLASAADTNDLSGWCGAYWLMKQRLAQGRGYPTLAGDGDGDGDEGQQPAAAAAAAAAGDGVADPASNPPPPARESRETDRGGFRGAIALLRGRRLGLASPRGTVDTLATTSVVESRRHQRLLPLPPPLPQPQPPDGVSLPPITVRSAGNSERATQRSATSDQQLQRQQRPRQPKLQAARYLSYIRRQEDALPSVLQAQDSGDAAADTAASEIRVRVLPRRHHQRNPTATMTALSPRQPPNSRIDVGRPYDAAESTAAAARPDAPGAAADDARLGMSGTGLPPSPPPPAPCVWENAIVDWRRWSRSRAACS